MRVARIAVLAVSTVSILLADVTYDQSIKYTGGSVLEIARMMAKNPMLGHRAGGLGSAFQDQQFTVYIKGSKMARIGQSTSTLIDLDAGTMTTVNNQAHTYNTRTFEQMRQQLEAMQHSQGEMQFDVNIDKSGKTQDIDGQTATETMVTITAKPGSSNPNLVVRLDDWMLAATASTREVVEFLKRLSEKYTLALGGMGPAASGINAAMNAALQLDGYPALSNMSVSGVTAPMMNQKGDPNAPFLTSETRSSNFISRPVDDSIFAVPAGYTQEQPSAGRPQ